MTESNFPFVENLVLRQNLDEAFDHIVTLLPFTESKTYNEAAKSAFRKTIIIYTASIVEALLFHTLRNKFKDEDIAEYYSTWDLVDKKSLYSVDRDHEIVAGSYKRILGKSGIDKMNLAQISDYLRIKDVIGVDLHQKVDDIRKLRNEQHIGPHKKVQKYTSEDLEKAFSVASRVKEFVKTNL